MRIVTALPPNYAKILAAFTGAANPNVMFCYGDVIYNPSGQDISEALLAHEAVHSRRQGDDPEGWWDRYIADTQFRMDEELVAHAEEYRVESKQLSRPARRHALKQIAQRLSGPLYGRCTTYAQARVMILKFAALMEPECKTT